MHQLKATIVACLGMLAAGAALGADPTEIIQRNTNQQERIEQGLQSGQLTTKEAAKLERGEAQVERMEAKAMSDGKLSNAEQQRIDRALDERSKEIYRDKHNAAQGNPASSSSTRMQADVQRNINQQQRIEQGVTSGELTNREAGKLEAGQAHVERKEARAGADGSVSTKEQRRIQAAENDQSKHIHREKHDQRKHN